MKELQSVAYTAKAATGGVKAQQNQMMALRCGTINSGGLGGDDGQGTNLSNCCSRLRGLFYRRIKVELASKIKLPAMLINSEYQLVYRRWFWYCC